MYSRFQLRIRVIYYKIVIYLCDCLLRGMHLRSILNLSVVTAPLIFR